MVFSKTVENEGKWGTAYVAPFNNDIEVFYDLYTQAGNLSYAEGSRDRNLVKGNNRKWCVIGILFNPRFDAQRKQELLDQYHEKLDAEGINDEYTHFCIGDEPSILSRQGEITINWPKAISPKRQAGLDDLDFIIATCPKQNIASYPDVATIKQAVVVDNRDYFYNNIENGITTYQDREIMVM